MVQVVVKTERMKVPEVKDIVICVIPNMHENISIKAKIKH